jgi:hypothetical protein
LVVAGIVVLTYGKPLILKKALGIFIILFVLNSLKSIKHSCVTKINILFGFMGGFFGTIAADPIYVIIIQNETSDIRP